MRYPCPLHLPGCRGDMSHKHAKGCAACVVQLGKGALGGGDRTKTGGQTVTSDRELASLRSRLSMLDKKYREALDTIDRLEKDLKTSNVLSNVDTYEIKPRKGSRVSEATPVIVASDWHIEERVDPASVSGLNDYSLPVAQMRSVRFFQSALRLVNLLRQDVQIETVVLALLGDFITNNIHEELTDVTRLLPMDAIAMAQNHLISGIEFLLRESPYSFVIPCHSGNHARTTKTTRFSVENGHSIEYLMYLHLAAYFRKEPRVKFIIPEGYHSYLQVYDHTIRFHHGHAIKYAGGVGGIFIPAFKAIAQWNKGRHADIDVFGHFHQMKDGGNFLSNGSLIGYNGFALAIKADFEPPRQTLFLMDKRRGRTCTWPVLVS